MKLQIRKNRFNNINAVEEWGDAEYYFHLGDNMEISVNPFHILEFRLLETVGCVLVGFSDHLGTPIYSNDFISFKNNDVGKYIYNRFKSEGNITNILKEMNTMPFIYNHYFLVQHSDPSEKPTIVKMR